MFAVTDCIQNAAHGSSTSEAAGCELEFMFPSSGPGRRNTACYIDTTCAVIKPHAIRDGELWLAHAVSCDWLTLWVTVSHDWLTLYVLLITWCNYYLQTFVQFDWRKYFVFIRKQWLWRQMIFPSIAVLLLIGVRKVIHPVTSSVLAILSF